MATIGPGRQAGITMAAPSVMAAGSLTHFAITFQNASNAAVDISSSDDVKNAVMRVLGTKGTPVIVGTLENTGSTLRVAFENTCGWTAADATDPDGNTVTGLDTALKALGTVDSIDLSGSDAVAFVY